MSVGEESNACLFTRTIDSCSSAVTVADSLMKGDTTARFFIGIAYTVGSDSINTSSLEKWSNLESYFIKYV